MVDVTAAPTTPLPELAEFHPTPGTIVRAMGVVVAGPALLDALELLGTASAIGRWPRRMKSARACRATAALTAAGVAALVVDHGVVRPWLRRLGSTPAERASRMPGDRDTALLFTATRAVTVNAPADEVWQWLVQIGQDRGGFYSFDWLENLAGCQLASADVIHHEWQDREAGDPLLMFPGFGTRLLEVDPPHAMVIENWGAYVIEPVDDATCRLIARSPVERSPGSLGYLAFIELPHAIMELKMLHGIKKRAEGRYAGGGRRPRP